MKVGILTNVTKDNELFFTTELVKLLKKHDIEFFFESKSKEFFPNQQYFDCHNIREGMELIIVLGGDGTMLHVAKNSAFCKMPILGINLGFVGFLTEIELAELEEAIELIKSNRYTIEERALLRVTIGGFEGFALNEVVLGKEDLGKMISLKVFTEDELIDMYRCDGLIISTPTGSTAYSMSAGGPILAPDSGVVSITPISPQSMHARPLIVKDTERLTVRVSDTRNKGCLVLDGVTVKKFDFGESVRIEKSEFYAKFIRVRKYLFYSKLLSKLNKWGVTEDK